MQFLTYNSRFSLVFAG